MDAPQLSDAFARRDRLIFQVRDNRRGADLRLPLETQNDRLKAVAHGTATFRVLPSTMGNDWPSQCRRMRCRLTDLGCRTLPSTKASDSVPNHDLYRI